MVEINNQRKAFHDMLAWSEELITDVRKPEIALWRHCRRRAIYWILDHPRKLVTPNPKLKSTRAPDATSFFPVGGMPIASSLAWKTSLRKVRTLAYSRLRAWRFTYDWSWWYPSGNRPLQQYLGFTMPGAGYGQFEHKADSLIAKFKEAGGTVEDWCMSRVWVSPLWLSASSSACHGLLIITVITPLPTSPARQKCQRTEAGVERGNYWHADASTWCAALDAKYTRRVSWC